METKTALSTTYSDEQINIFMSRNYILILITVIIDSFH